ncbi:MAG: ribonuclease Y [Ruminococcaceae bacterium]|nr:ribonuclease Y [Oscillospiraceae bacterium]MBD5117284.1 ribonuclease Y [Oscillospiraceae bacterium]
MELWLAIVLIVVALAVGGFAGFMIYRKMVETQKKNDEAMIVSAQKEAERIVSEAKEKAATAKKTALLEAKEESYKLRENAEKEIQKQRGDAERELKERRAEVTKSERRLLQKEENLDRKTDKIERLEESLTARNENVKKKLAEAEALKDEQQAKLQEISGYTAEQAKELLLAQLDSELTHEKAVKILAYQQQLKDESDDKARSVIALAISRLASETVSEMTVSVVPLPNDEMKGRIIGREGRNIRTLEQLTGVDLIIDDTPEAITLSSHDKVRREIARISLERLIQDGRIHPTRIEEMVEKAKREVEQKIKREGEHACLETNVNGLSPELVKLLGRLHFRTSYSQNVLIHSIEVAHLAGIMASELGVDAALARRAGLLHDIGKALTHEIEGSHVAIGVEVCKKYKENPEVIHAVEAHHGDVECRTVIAALVQAADAISAARPAARSENYESYIKRLQKLEEICTDYDGVDKSYAIQAGREVRILIKPEVVNDEAMTVLARDIASRIEQEVDYPGQIKINLIRESRAVDYAK